LHRQTPSKTDAANSKLNLQGAQSKQHFICYSKKKHVHGEQESSITKEPLACAKGKKRCLIS